MCINIRNDTKYHWDATHNINIIKVYYEYICTFIMNKGIL